MAITISKPVKRKVVAIIDNRLEPRKQDYITVTLYPSGYIGLRPHKSRKEYMEPVANILIRAMKREAPPIASKKKMSVLCLRTKKPPEPTVATA